MLSGSPTEMFSSSLTEMFYEFLIATKHLDYVFGAENISIFTLGAKSAFCGSLFDSDSNLKSNKTNQEPEEKSTR